MEKNSLSPSLSRARPISLPSPRPAPPPPPFLLCAAHFAAQHQQSEPSKQRAPSHLAAAADERVPRPVSLTGGTNLSDPSPTSCPHRTPPNHTGSAHNPSRTPCSAQFALYILARPSPSPLSNPSASRRAASAEKRRRDPPRKQSAAATHLGLREYSTELLIVLATPPSLLSRDFMLSTLRATSPNFRRGRRPPSAVAGTLWSISALLLAIGEFALSSTTPRCNRFVF